MSQQLGETTVGDCFARQVERRGDQPALVDEAGQAVSYRQLDARREWFAGRLPDVSGTGRQARIGLLLPNGVDFAAALLAILGQGCLAVPLNPRLSPRELASADACLHLDALIADQERRQLLADGLPGLAERLLPSDGMPPRPSVSAQVGAQRPAVSPATPAVCLATSGTTGQPKWVVRSQGSLLCNRRQVAAALGLDERDRVVAVVPFCHANGFSNCLLLPLLTGATLVAVPRFVPVDFAAICRRQAVTVLIGSPFIFAMLLESTAEAADFTTARLCLSSGARLAPAIATAWRERFKLPIRQLYGSSETGTIAIGAAADDDPQCVGRSVPGVELRFANLPDRQAGDQPGGAAEILVRSPAMMDGYLAGDTLDRRRFDGDFLRTGDQGRLDHDGRLYLLGRHQSLINVCGIKVDPVEIESVLIEIPGVKRAVVAGQIDARGMETIAATLFVNPQSTLNRADVVRFCRGKLAEYKIPRHLTFTTTSTDAILGKHGNPKEN